MRVGVDIDGVLNDILSICVEGLNDYLEVTLTTEDMTDYNFAKSYQVPQEKVVEFFIREETNILRNAAPQQNAAETLFEMNKQHQIILVTARPENQRKVTEEWLKKHEIDYDKLIMVGSSDKRKACLKERIDVLIEDSLENALMVNGQGIPVILMNAPHNQGKLPQGITRVSCWLEAEEHLADHC